MKISPIEFFFFFFPILALGRAVSFRVNGNSMYPFLSDGDSVIIKSKPRYRKWDIVFAKVSSSDQIVLHYIAGDMGDSFKLMGSANLCQEEICLKTDVAACLQHPRINRWKVGLWHILLPYRRYLLWLYRRIL